MIDIQILRDDPAKVAEAAASKGYRIDTDALLELDTKKRTVGQQIDEARAKRNIVSDKVKNAGGKPDPDLIDEGKQIKFELGVLEEEFRSVDEAFTTLLKKVPNLPTADVPIGASEDENIIAKTVGTPPRFDFAPKNHAQIAEAKGWLDKERAAKVAGSRFAYLKGDLVMLDWAMNMFALSQLTNRELITRLVQENGLAISDKPFVAVQPPAVARTEVYEATGRLNKEEQTYKLAEDDLWLNASAEHVLAPMYMNEILTEEELPHRYVGYTTAFRREAGTYGKDMEGFLRMHQFNKLEMEIFSTAATSFDEHLLAIAIQEHLMAALELPYRVVQKCTADIGGPNARGIDIDVWLPGQDQYRETHTADLLTDYQTRRMQTRVRKADGTLELAHTNDATALSQRPLIAVLENYQTAEGNVRVPTVLRPYLGGRELL